MDRYPDHSAPLVLGWAKAVDQAEKLRRHGLAYPAVAAVMAEYHGWHYSDATWRGFLHERGVPKNPAKVRSAAANFARATA